MTKMKLWTYTAVRPCRTDGTTPSTALHPIPTTKNDSETELLTQKASETSPHQRTTQNHGSVPLSFALVVTER